MKTLFTLASLALVVLVTTVTTSCVATNKTSRALVEPIYTYCVSPCDCGGSSTTGTGTYPVFQIPLDGLNNQFCDFELKASTNNFYHATEDGRLVYWYDSMGTSMSEFNTSIVADKAANVFVCASANDPRSYLQVDNSIALGIQIGVTRYQDIVLISPSHDVPGADVWMKETNEKLIWSFRRRTLQDGEQESGSNRSLWHPIVPMYWKTTQFNPL